MISFLSHSIASIKSAIAFNWKSANSVESLKYYKIDYIPISDRLYYEYADELLLHIRELVELENGIDFINNNEDTALSGKRVFKISRRERTGVSFCP